MHCVRSAFVGLLLSAFAVSLPAQQKHPTESRAKQAKDVDSLALDVLRAVTEPVEKAQEFSFKALVSEDEMATNGQLVTFFHTVDVTVHRPDKVHLIFKGRGERVDFYGSSGSITMYSPDSKLYATIPAKATIDDNLRELIANGVDMPIGPFLSANLYELASNNLLTGYVIGRVKVFDQDVHQLVFTAPDADWQLWVTGGETPRIVRVELVNKKLEGKPRTVVQFLDWNLSPAISDGEFKFSKPADAVPIKMLQGVGGR
jgi:hypothetical protein